MDEFITVFLTSTVITNPIHKPVSELFDVQINPQRPFYFAGFAVDITLGTLMRITKEPYAGSDEVDGYYESPGAIFTFAEGERKYSFKVEDSMPEYAVSLPAVFDGRRVTVMVHAPHAASSLAIAIPRNCFVFLAALAELEQRGVKYVMFFNQPSGGYLEIPVSEVAGA